jgi:nitrogen fixation protein FixH
MINLKPFISVMEASNGLSGLIVENTKVINDNFSQKEFEELKSFAETYLLKGNLDRFLVKE